MKKCRKLLAALFGIIMLVSCMTSNVWAAETITQDGLTAVIQTDKDTYAANEDIQVTVTVTNINSFTVQDVSIESLLPDGLTLKSGDLQSETVDLRPEEKLSVTCVAVLEKVEPTPSAKPTPTANPTEEPTPTEEPLPTDESSPTSEPLPTDEPTPTGEPLPTNDPNPTNEPLPTAEPTATSKPVATMEPVSTSKPTDGNPQTGDTSPILIALLVLVVAAAMTFAVVVAVKKNNSKARKVLSIVLCGAIAVSSVATIGFIKVGAEEARNVFTVDKAVVVDGDEYLISGNVSYQIQKDFEFTIDQTDFTTIENKIDLTGKINTSIQATSISYKVYSEIDNGDFDYNGLGVINGERWSINQIRLKPGVNKITVTVETPEKSIDKSINVTYDFGEAYTPDKEHIVITDEDSSFGYVDNVIIICFETHSDTEKQKIIDDINGTVVGRVGSSEYHVQVKARSLDELKQLCNELIEKEEVWYATYDIVSSIAPTASQEITIPDDPWKDVFQGIFGTDWNEEKPDGLNWGLEAIQVPSAWNYNDRFSTITIGIVDDGFDTSHEDLSITTINPDNVPKNHGTEVAGIIGAEANNQKGMTGIVWNKKLIGIDKGIFSEEEICNQANFYSLIQRAIEEGAKVVNLSQTLSSPMEEKEEIIENGVYATYQILKWIKEINDDFLVVEGAGNTNTPSTTNGYFNSITDEAIQKFFSTTWEDLAEYDMDDVYNHFMTVGAIEQRGEGYRLCSQRDFTLFSYNSSYGESISIVAPGFNIFTCDIMNDSNGNYCLAHGTSMATPMVTSVAALVWSVNPDFSAGDVKEIVCTSTNKTATGYIESDNRVYPVVNAKLAVEEAIRRTDEYSSTIFGSVVDAETGEPLEASISVSIDDDMMAFTTSDPETGDFGFHNIHDGTYTLLVTKQGYESYTQTVEVKPNHIVMIGSIALQKNPPDPVPPTEISGSVKDESTDLFMEGVEVSVYDESGSELVATAVTNAEGKFTVSLENEGVYDLKFSKEGYEEATIDNFRAVASYGSNSVGLISMTPIEEDDTHYIYTAEDFNAIREDLDGNYVLMNDIDLSEYSENWEPIGLWNNDSVEVFSGRLDGNGHTVYGFNVRKFNSPESHSQFGYTWGLFGFIYGATIENLNLYADIYINESYTKGSTVNLGSIAGYGFGTIKNCTTYGKIYSHIDFGFYSGSVAIGGIAGSSWDQDIKVIDSKNYVNVQLDTDSTWYIYIGGIIGQGTVEHCFNQGNIYCLLRGAHRYTYICGLTYNKAVNSCNAANSVIINIFGDPENVSFLMHARNSENCFSNENLSVNGEALKDMTHRPDYTPPLMSVEELKAWYNSQ